MSGPACDYRFLGWAPYFESHQRYRIVGDVSVIPGTLLSTEPGASILFESRTKISAVDADADFGFHVEGTPEDPVYLLAAGPEPSSENVVRGVKVRGQMRLRNGGAIKLY